MTTETDNDPYAEGTEAAHCGKSMAHCPYEYGTPDGDKWAQVFQDAGGTD